MLHFRKMFDTNLASYIISHLYINFNNSKNIDVIKKKILYLHNVKRIKNNKGCGSQHS